jgi:hypothetical protein
MQNLTEEGRRLVSDVAGRHGFSADAVTHMLVALADGYGNQAQFSHHEFGGMGQWSSGGMVMIGDMFNNNLKGRVSSLCQELAGLIHNQPMFAAPAQSQSQSQDGGQSQGRGQWQNNTGQSQSSGGSSLFVSGGKSGNWWPTELGHAGSTGAQNNLRYACFPATRRLAIDINGQITMYDTGDHQIGGFSQQQSGDQSLTFTSQFGTVRVADLPVVHGDADTSSDAVTKDDVAKKQSDAVAETRDDRSFTPVPAAATQNFAASIPAPSQAKSSGAAGISTDEIFTLIEKLAALHAKGILTDAEYEAKKTELLGRL